MNLSNYFRIAVYFCLVMIIFTLAINFVSALNIFPSVESGMEVDTSDGATDIVQRISGFSGELGSMWSIITIATAGIAIVVARIIGNASVIGVWLFSEIFWTSYSRAMTVTNIGGYIGHNFLIMFTVALVFIWIAAVISMMTSVS